MDINEKKINRTRSFVNWTVTIVLALFLILLSSSILYDMGSSVKQPRYEHFTSTSEITSARRHIDSLETFRTAVLREIDTLEKKHEASNADYARKKESFDNWVATRRALGRPDTDSEVVSRTMETDRLLDTLKNEEAAIGQARSRLGTISEQRDDAENGLMALEEKATELFESAYNVYQLKIFGLRLLLAAPVLALGIWFFIRFRHHKYKALFLGFSLYSLYVFFVGLVPYLPSFGGYVRYGVGVLLAVSLGYYAIKYINTYVERKQAALKEAAVQRAAKIRQDTAQKAYDAHVCPSCGKDFLVKPWEYTEKGPKASSFCQHCGMELYISCPNCGHENFAHFHYCKSCGKPLKKEQND